MILMIVGIVLALLLLYHNASLPVWLIMNSLYLWMTWQWGDSSILMSVTSVLWVGIALFSMTFLRKRVISEPIFKVVKKSMPAMSSTEKEALEAGTITWEGELFTGRPDFDKLFNAPGAVLSDEEQLFLNNEVNALCEMLNEWDITHHQLDLSDEIWTFIKSKGFLGMIIPKSYGGLALSASAQYAILTKIYSCSVTCATTVSVPNSLGPAELLLKYGTEEQKNYYLPRLACGEEIPCFALTGPNAGSDAASVPDTGVVCHMEQDGEQVIGIKLNWSKRYITLAPVATLIGLAFRLFDPNCLLGNKQDLGITCALIPATLDGIDIGQRHFPLNTAFMNGPIQGNDVLIPISSVIGGRNMVGQGWRMLMECLGAGRAVSLPSSSVGGCKVAAFATGAYASIRRQFNTAIANFEGIKEPLARIAAETYITTASTEFTIASLDQGEAPSVASAILKYQSTESNRRVCLDAMDIHGGKGICLGPNNYIGRNYQNAPISVTVEGANILTRCLIIFGQGAVRCHPHLFSIMSSVEENSLTKFDDSIFKFAGAFISNSLRSFIYALSDGWISYHPNDGIGRPIQLLKRYTAHFALLTDYALMIIGGHLKFRESLSGRLADLLGHLYLLSSVIKQFYQDGMPHEDKPIFDWCCLHLLHLCQTDIEGVVSNFPGMMNRILLKGLTSNIFIKRHAPSDKLTHQVASLISEHSPTRQRLLKYVFEPKNQDHVYAKLQRAFDLVEQHQGLQIKLSELVKAGELTELTQLEQIEQARQLEKLTEEECNALRETELARQEIIVVDQFTSESLQGG